MILQEIIIGILSLCFGIFDFIIYRDNSVIKSNRKLTRVVYMVFNSLFMFSLFSFFKNYESIKLDSSFLLVIPLILCTILIAYILQFLTKLLGISDNSIKYDKVYLKYQIFTSIRAGIYEEILFRLVILNILFFYLKLAGIEKCDVIIAVFIDSILFSFMHYPIIELNARKYSGFSKLYEREIWFKLFINFLISIILCIIYIYSSIFIVIINHILMDFLIRYSTLIHNKIVNYRVKCILGKGLKND